MAVPAINVNNSHSNNVARRQPRPGINTSVVFTLRNMPVTEFWAEYGPMLRAGLDGSSDDDAGHGDDGSSLNRGYEFPPHRRGRLLDREYHRPYYESEGEEEVY
jgi:hypothetical protein